MRPRFLLSLAVIVLVPLLRAEDVRVTNAAEFRAALAAAGPGTRILLAAGSYGAGFRAENLHGTATDPIRIAAEKRNERPLFQGGRTGLHLSRVSFVEIQGLEFQGQASNGVNIDDGGETASAGDGETHHVTLRDLRVTDVGRHGNEDGLKLSGVRQFRIEGCLIESWGTGGGSAIDLVGCHDGTITGNTLRHRWPAPPNCTGLQAKGGSSRLVIRGNRFVSAGGRALNLGGSTATPYFRPALVEGGEHAEARDLVVEENSFVGGVAAIAFVGVDGATVRRNTIERPERWALRILQETTGGGFVPCRRVNFSDNRITFLSTQWAEGGINVGPDTSPETFSFSRNVWLCSDRPDRSRPRLPVPETNGIYGPATAP